MSPSIAARLQIPPRSNSRSHSLTTFLRIVRSRSEAPIGKSATSRIRISRSKGARAPISFRKLRWIRVIRPESASIAAPKVIVWACADKIEMMQVRVSFKDARTRVRETT